MGTTTKSKSRTVRIPLIIDKIIEENAKRHHDGNYSASLVDFLLKVIGGKNA